MKKIDDIKASLRRSSNITYVLSTINEMTETYKDITDSALLEYVPVKIVSCFEEHFRQIYKDIIDRLKFKKNIKNVKSLKNLRFDLDFLDDIQSSDITLSDYISYNFSCSSLEQIFEQLGALLNIDFKKCLIEKIIEVEGKADIPEKEGRENVYYYIESVSLIFHMRHIICHEGRFHKKLDNDFIMQMISDAQLFLEIVDKLLYDILYSGISMTQAEMDKESTKSYEKADEELHTLIEYLKHNVTESKLNFDYISTWKEYRKQKAESECSIYKNTSIYPTMCSMNMESTTRLMISLLCKEYHLYDKDWK